MIDFPDLYERIDDIWPIKRHPSVKAEERQALTTAVSTDKDADALRNKIEILVEDHKSAPRKTPSLLSVLSNFKPATKTVIVSSAPLELPKEETQEDPAEVAFQEIFEAWPENEISQNQKFARQAFMYAVSKYTLETVKKVCQKYIAETTNPAAAPLHILGIKRLLSDQEIFEDWLQKAESTRPDYDSSFFNVAYHFYPEFKGKDLLATVDESRGFYRRFIKENDAVEFLCAVKAYRDERGDEVRASRYRDDYTPESEAKFTKTFCNFIRVWKQQSYSEFLAEFINLHLANVCKQRGYPYELVYPDGMLSALRWNCALKDDEGKLKGFVFAITKTVEDVAFYLKNGENYYRIRREIEPDYAIVSDTVAAAKQEAKTMPVAGKVLEVYNA